MKDDAHEASLVAAGDGSRRLELIAAEQIPPCIDERGMFMSPFGFARTKRHPYAESSPKTHGHFAATSFSIPAWAAACVPFRWMLRKEAAGDAKEKIAGKRNELRLGYEPEREPSLSFDTSWVQERQNQLTLLDTFFGALEPNSSLCFFYAKSTPLADDTRRVIVGVGRVLRVDGPVEYEYAPDAPDGALRCVLWERNVRHSIRPGFEDGFLFPYQALVERCAADPSLDPAQFAAFVPDDLFEAFSYGSELLPHDGAVASLVACAAALRKIKEVLPGPWDDALRWLDRELDCLWKARGAFPGLGAALCAFGLERGTLIGHAIASTQEREKCEWTDNPWKRVEAIFDDPTLLPGGEAHEIGATFRDKFRSLSAERRALLELLARCALTADQATRFWQPAEREKSGIYATDSELIANPYLLFELDRGRVDSIAFEVVDRGVFAEDVVRAAFPVPVPSAMTDAIDARRVRAAVVDAAELAAATSGHTLLPRSWAIQRVRDRALSPPCPVDEDTLRVVASTFAPTLETVPMVGGEAFQLDRFVETRAIISKKVGDRASGKRHERRFDWKRLIDMSLPSGPIDDEERRAREEKTAALEEIYASRVSVLVGAAGTGKTTLLRVLCEMDEVKNGGVLLLAPTGKARVRLETQTKLLGQGRTLAQFLLSVKRFDGATGTYFVDSNAPRSKAHKTVIVDECSMLTEEALAALLDALEGVDRIVLVGDPRQLPPIGAGRPFVDVVRKLAADDIEAKFPRRSRGYAELTVVRRQDASRDDVLLAAHFSGRALDAGADEIWDRLDRGESSGVRVVPWSDGADLEAKIVAEIVGCLRLKGDGDELGFGLALGGHEHEGHVYFRAGESGKAGAVASVEDWQVLSPIRGLLWGTDVLNQQIQTHFRTGVRKWAVDAPFWNRKVPPPLGPQGILWGDKVINVVNNPRRRCFPKADNAFVANGDLGVVVGEYKYRGAKHNPKNLEVELASYPGIKFTYRASEVSGDEGDSPLELAYALTVHKAQGSEFKRTFVVVPNPCRLLSRELLYTALTRHQDGIVLMPQGPVRGLLRYAHQASSEIAGRMTNLFHHSAPTKQVFEGRDVFLEAGLIHRTKRGDLVRSKSEVVIAGELHAKGIDYRYEEPVVVDGSKRYPDFTIVNDDRGETFYWEHLGMLGDPQYAKRWARKLDAYRRSGILPTDEGIGENGRLVVTRDDPNGGIDVPEIVRIIDEIIVGK